MFELTQKRAPVCLLTGRPLERPALAQRGPAATRVSPAPLAREGSGLTKEGPALTKEGPALTKEGPGLTKEGPALTKEGPGLTKEGPALTKEGPGLTKEGPALTKEGFTQTQRVILEGTPPKLPDGGSPSPFHFSILRFAYFPNRDCILLETSVTQTKQSPPLGCNRVNFEGIRSSIHGILESRVPGGGAFGL